MRAQPSVRKASCPRDVFSVARAANRGSHGVRSTIQQKTPRPAVSRAYGEGVRCYTSFATKDESMKPPSNVKTPAQYIASLPADRAKTIAAVRAFVNTHIPRGYDECLVWGTIGWTIPLSRYPDTYNQQPICYVALSSPK